MDNNITLTNDEIHAMRVEHSRKTNNLSSEEYMKLLEAESAPVRSAIERIRIERAKSQKP